jgi:TolA-binding protein
MSNDEKSEYKGIVRKELLLPGISFIFLLIGFYYNTNFSIESLEEKVTDMQVEVKEKADTDEMNDKIRSMHQDIRDLQTSNQKILEILLEKGDNK